MTVKQLRDSLAIFPDNMHVFVAERKTEFAYGMVNSIKTKHIRFHEDPNGKVLAMDTVVVIDEE